MAGGNPITHAQPGDGLVFCIAPGRLLFDYYRDKSFSGQCVPLTLIYPALRDARVDPLAFEYLPAIQIVALRSALEKT